MISTIFSSLIFALAFCPSGWSHPDVGLNMGSSAAAKLLKHYTNSALRMPRQLHMDLRSGSGEPWFDPIAHVDSSNRITLGQLRVVFRNNQIEAEMNDVVVRSASTIFLLPLPFFFGEDTAHITAQIPQALIRLKVVDDLNVEIDECNLAITDMRIRLEKAYLLNHILTPLHQILPRTLVHDSACELLAESLTKWRRRFALEIPLISVVPEKALPYLLNHNVSIFTQLESVTAQNDQLVVSASIEWTEMSPQRSLSEFELSHDWRHNNSMPTPQPLVGEDLSSRSGGDGTGRGSQKSGEGGDENANPASERLQVWVEDRLLNELMEHFRWDFEWMEQNIPVDSPKLPKSTSAFLSTLCTNCYFLVRVTANGPPHVESVNSSIILTKSDKIFLKVVNPSRNVDAVFVNFALSLAIQLTPSVENGIFRTHVDLLDTDIRMEEGAFPAGWRGFVQDLVKGMIMDVIWPGLKREIETLLYSDGVHIPPYCGLEPNSFHLHFDEGTRFGASAALLLDELSFSHCLQQIKSKLPDPSKLFVIRENAI
ncbi:hypothetical protein Ddc_16136 [Ditylenchus destructor]|nr:hypothetical protein Ddc_16136 [Ditylenchus destructor]